MEGKKKGLVLEVLQKEESSPMTKHGNFTDLQKSLEESLTRLEELGNMADLPDTLYDVCISFVCHLKLRSHMDKKGIWEDCVKIFCKKPQQNERLPPCKDIIVQNCRRVNYQCFLWKHTLCALPEIQSPYESCWTIKSGSVGPVIMSQDSVPSELKARPHVTANYSDV